MDTQLLYIVSGIGVATMLGVFYRMRGGFGPMNLRAVGIILIGTFAAILAVTKAESLNASLGILGAIAGYLFGYGDSREKEQEASSAASVSSSTFGHGAKIAGRDINETIEHMQADLANIGKVVNNWKSAAERDPPFIAIDHRLNWESDDAGFLRRVALLDRKKESWMFDFIQLVFTTDEFRVELARKILSLSEKGWEVSAIRIRDTGSRGLYLDLNLRKPYKSADRSEDVTSLD